MNIDKTITSALEEHIIGRRTDLGEIRHGTVALRLPADEAPVRLALRAESDLRADCFINSVKESFMKVKAIFHLEGNK